MNLPTLIQRLYGQITFTGLYSFEFVDKNRNTITEIFFLTPPKGKTVSEPTRSTTVPTLGGNYILDGGNATKQTTLNGRLYFPYIGSPDKPNARNNTGLENTLNGLEEFLKMQWMLVRYRDYAMTKNSKLTVPTSILAVSSEINALYKKVSNRLKKSGSALYDEIRLIFHDYDMDDHFYCRVDNFTSSQSDSNYIAIDYNITLDMYEVDTRKSKQKTEVKPSSNEAVDVNIKTINLINVDTAIDSIQDDIGSNSDLESSATSITDTIANMNTENEEIQAGRSTVLKNMPGYAKNLYDSTVFSQNTIINSYLSSDQLANYENGDTQIEDVLSADLINYFRVLQELQLQAESLSGFLNSIPQQEVIRYSENANDYVLTEEQFDPSDTSDPFVVETTPTFYYYTVLEGDTARIVALRELNDSEKFVTILRLNDITEDDFIEGNIIGQQIKIPLEAGALARYDDNLVFEPNFDEIEKFLYGSDINSSVNGEFVISDKGDIAGLDGIENAYVNIENRISINKGGLNIFNTDFGVTQIGNSNAPLLVQIERYLTDVVNQIQSDPRVESVKMDLDRLEWNGDKLSVPSKVFFIGTESVREVTV